MKLLFPDNFYSRLIKESLPDALNKEISFLPSALIADKTSADPDIVGLVPTLDLIRHKDLYISKSFGITFESSLCNTYIYFNTHDKNINELFIGGDVSSMEVILAKILFEEVYDSSIDIKISPDLSKLDGKNFMLVGDENFNNKNYSRGISFAEEIADAFSIPFVNYVFASSSDKLIKEINKQLKNISTFIYDKIESGGFGSGLTEEQKNYIIDNFSSFIFDLTDQDMEAVNQLIQLPYLKGIVDNITEVKFV